MIYKHDAIQIWPTYIVFETEFWLHFNGTTIHICKNTWHLKF